MERAPFVPGRVLAGRFRIVALLGRGGMGEVYRADDLKLGQAVALKFLPAEVGRHPGRLDAFLREVRLARQVSHPNVCRVHDIAEADGLHFLSMEFVDGEDLASLLSRMGRLPQKMATEIAREMCAGLAIIHDRGLVHRDLKPANIMIDGSGHAHITDFGLAEQQGSGGDPDVIVGTPAYMAPECLVEGRPPTIQSDLYSLGLVMYELFTGQPAFEAKSLKELIRLRRDTRPVEPSRHERGLDLLIERLIMRCLENDPAVRPSSARAVAAIFPGGDPLAAAIAAGETPSPELVASETGGEEGLRPALAWGGLAALVVGLALATALAPHTRLIASLVMPAHPGAWADRAQHELDSFGDREPAVDRAYGFTYHADVTERIAATERAPRRWRDLSRTHPDIVTFWYRESPIALEPDERRHRIGPDDPPAMAGAAEVEFDLSGQPLAVTRSGREPGASARPGDPSGSGRAPPSPHDPSARMTDLISGSLRPALLLAALLIGAWLARRNLRAGRGDTKRALRVATVLLLVRVAIWLLGGHHSAATFTDQFMAAIAWGLYDFAYGFVFYLAIEPYVRQLWPRMLTTWVRLVDGRLGDPRLGRDLLIGCLLGTFIALLVAAHQALPVLFGAPPGRPDNVGYVEHQLAALLGVRHQLADMLWLVRSNLTLVMGFAVILVMARLLVRRAIPSLALAFVIFVPLAMPKGEILALNLALAMVSTLALLIVMLRFGLLAAALGLLTHTMLQSAALRFELGAWATSSTLVVLAMVLGLGVYGCMRAIGGRVPAVAT